MRKRTLTNLQAHEVITWIKANHNAYKHHKLADVAAAVSGAVGFPVNADAIQRLGKCMGMPFSVAIPQEPEPLTVVQRLAALEDMVAAMKRDLYGTQEQLQL